jgi:hypothetical protein
MSLEGLNELKQNWTLNNSLTIVDGIIEGDLNTTGFIFGSGSGTSAGLTTNNVWTGVNTYTNFLPTYLLPINNNEMNTREYTNTVFNNIGNNLLTSPVTFSAQNTFNVMPKVASGASGNELIDKTDADTKVNAFSQLGSNNTWTGNNYFDNFLNDVTTPNPTLDTHIANKGYVDSSIVNFNNAGGKVDLVEFGTAGQHVVTCDPAIYSSMIVCMVSGGGYGSPNLNIDLQGAISFGGSGAMICWKMPAFSGNASYEAVFNTRTTVGFSNFYEGGDIIFGLFNGQNGNVNASGNGGTLLSRNADIVNNQYQMIDGSTQPRLLSSTVRRVSNICCWNGFGCGGSYEYVFGDDVPPTNNYCLLIKFKN